MTKLIHEELSYAVRGLLFDVYNQLGPTLPENFYQSAIAIGLESKGIRCHTEKQFEVAYRGVQVGRFYVDAWIEDGKMLLELKVVPQLQPVHRAQALSYLKVTDADLALVVNFGEGSLVAERLPNFIRNKTVQFVWQEEPISANLLYPELTIRILLALHHVHFELGPGFFHYVYRRATMVQLREQSLGYRYIKQVPLHYQEQYLGKQDSRLICVEDRILVAAVAVKEIDYSMKVLLKAKMRHQKVSLGVLANFNRTELEVVMVR